jgi:hypothetical protein
MEVGKREFQQLTGKCLVNAALTGEVWVLEGRCPVIRR